MGPEEQENEALTSVQGAGALRLEQRKQRWSDREIREAVSCGPLPKNARQLWNWLDNIQYFHDLNPSATDLLAHSSLSMLLDPDFAFVWTPACTREFREILCASGVIFEPEVADRRRPRALLESGHESDYGDQYSESSHNSSDSNNSAQEIVDLRSSSNEFGEIVDS